MKIFILFAIVIGFVSAIEIRNKEQLRLKAHETQVHVKKTRFKRG